MYCFVPTHTYCFTYDAFHSTRIDRKLLLNFLRVSKAMEKQGYSMSALFTALNYKLDFSGHSSISSGRFGQENAECDGLHSHFLGHWNNSLSHRIIFIWLPSRWFCTWMSVPYITQSASSVSFQIFYMVEVNLLSLHYFYRWFICKNICLNSLSKGLLCQFLTLILNSPMAMSLKWASSLSKALGKHLDLSDTPLNYRTCESLQLVLDYTEELTDLNLSYCQITDACLDLLALHLNKIMNLEWVYLCSFQLILFL